MLFKKLCFLLFLLTTSACGAGCSPAQPTPNPSATSPRVTATPSVPPTPISTAVVETPSQPVPTAARAGISRTTTIFPSQTPAMLTARAVDESPTPTPKNTRTPTFTPQPPTLTTIPSLNPTLAKVLSSSFDPQRVITRTPSLPQVCPQVNPEVKPEFPGDYVNWPRGFSIRQAILDYLNAGGEPKLLEEHLYLGDYSWAQTDVTGDGVPEVMIAIWGLGIYMCRGGQYINIFFYQTGDNPGSPGILAITDMNLDGIPEVVLRGAAWSVGALMYSIYEWDGEAFQSLIWSEAELSQWFYTRRGRAMKWYEYWIADDYYLSPAREADGIVSSAIVRDMDRDGTQELVIYNDIPIPSHRYDGPFRKTTETYRWNGLFFILDQIEIEAPAYRVQAVQDADRLSLLGETQKALELYQAAIFSDKLGAWSLDHYHEQFHAENGLGVATPTLLPYEPEEYNHLAAYARYRILLLHLVQNDLESAQIVYDTLQEKFPQGQSGYLYAEMAAEVWEKYQSGGDMGEACSAAIRYAEEHVPDIFTYLGNMPHIYMTHGGQSHYYMPWDVCPFE
jgi:hypothetical protein